MSDEDLRKALSPVECMRAYKSYGGTAPEPTKKVLDEAKDKLK